MSFHLDKGCVKFQFMQAMLWFYDGYGDRCSRTSSFFEPGLVSFDEQAQLLVGGDISCWMSLA